MGRQRKHGTYQPYLDYIGVSDRERREWNKERKMKSKCCGAEIYYLQNDFFEPWKADGRPYCKKCHKPAEIKGIEFECSICNKKIENSPENRVKIGVGEASYTPQTWGICPNCLKSGQIEKRW